MSSYEHPWVPLVLQEEEHAEQRAAANKAKQKRAKRARPKAAAHAHSKPLAPMFVKPHRCPRGCLAQTWMCWRPAERVRQE